MVSRLPLLPPRSLPLPRWLLRRPLLPPQQPPGRRVCVAPGRLLVRPLLRVLVGSFADASLCRLSLSLVTLAPLELVALLLLPQVVASSLAPPSEVVLGAALAPPSELAPAPLSLAVLSWWWCDAPSEVPA